MPAAVSRRAGQRSRLGDRPGTRAKTPDSPPPPSARPPEASPSRCAPPLDGGRSICPPAPAATPGAPRDRRPPLDSSGGPSTPAAGTAKGLVACKYDPPAAQPSSTVVPITVDSPHASPAPLRLLQLSVRLVTGPSFCLSLRPGLGPPRRPQVHEARAISELLFDTKIKTFERGGGM